ncbi:MAG: hypothetical protein ACF8PN_03600 [Phycisphaerales bacterium]
MAAFRAARRRMQGNGESDSVVDDIINFDSRRSRSLLQDVARAESSPDARSSDED